MLAEVAARSGGLVLAAYLAGCVGFRLATREHVVRGEAAALVAAVAALVAAGRLEGLAGNPGAAAALLLAEAAAAYVVWRSQVRGPRPGAHLDMRGRLVVVTGANSGIGIETARGVARMGAEVVLACRTAETAKEACEDIRRSTGNDKVSVMPLDMGSFASVRAFAAALAAKHERLDVLVHNAGVMLPARRVSADGNEMTLQVNHLSVQLLTQLLLPLLERSDLPGGARVTLVSSTMHKVACALKGRYDFEDMQCKQHYDILKSYSQSKLALELFRVELDRQLRERGAHVCVNSLMPGTVLTKITRNLPWILGQLQPLLLPVNKTLSMGAYTTLYVATSPEVSGVSGRWFEHCGERPQPAAARNLEDAARLWRLTEELTNR